jgi:hypothetical protein
MMAGVGQFGTSSSPRVVSVERDLSKMTPNGPVAHTDDERQGWG